MCYSNVLNMLELAGVPLLASERSGLENIVFAGGVCAVNPEPLADFIDFFSLGEGEESTVEIVECYRTAKKEHWSKARFLKAVSAIAGVYVPSFYEHSYNPDGTIAAITPLEGAPQTVRKRIVQNMDTAYWPEKQIVPSTEIVHDRSNQASRPPIINTCPSWQTSCWTTASRARSTSLSRRSVRTISRAS